MNLKEKFYDRLGFKRESTVNSMKANQELRAGNIVKVAETGYFYDIKNTSTSIPLNNGLFAEVKQTTFLQIVTKCVSDLTNLTSAFNSLKNSFETLKKAFETHEIKKVTQSQDGHMSKEDKKKLDGVAENANNYKLPNASATVVGGVKIGENLSISSDGTISAKSPGEVQIFGNRFSGYAIFPGGYIEQWIHRTSNPPFGTSVHKFPIPFPNDCLNLILSREVVNIAKGGTEGMGVAYRDKESFTVYSDSYRGGFWVRAVGN